MAFAARAQQAIAGRLFAACSFLRGRFHSRRANGDTLLIVRTPEGGSMFLHARNSPTAVIPAKAGMTAV
ncbi:conserved hypothetical protein [Ahrensia sp. R2A130]|nr:conserved hypothetical protein [Ahrensia sp. R2A130]